MRGQLPGTPPPTPQGNFTQATHGATNHGSNFTTRRRNQLSSPHARTVTPSSTPHPRFDRRPRSDIQRRGLSLPRQRRMVMNHRFNHHVRVTNKDVLHAIRRRRPTRATFTQAPRHARTHRKRLLQRHMFSTSRTMTNHGNHGLSKVARKVRRRSRLVIYVFNQGRIFSLLLHVSTTTRRQCPSTTKHITHRNIQAYRRRPFIVSPRSRPRRHRNHDNSDNGRRWRRSRRAELHL